MAEVQSLARGLQILDFVWQASRSVSGSEMATHLSIDKSTASRLIQTLISSGYLAPEPGSRRVVPGHRLYQIGWAMGNRVALREKSRPFLLRLAAETGECAHMAVFCEGSALVIDDVETQSSLRVVGGTGRMIPLHCTAVGKALLAFSDIPPPAELKAMMPRTITSPEQLQQHLADIRVTGYAIDDQEHEPGVRCMAAPIYSNSGFAIAVIGISGPTIRVTDERLESLANDLIQVARDLSVDLGYVSPAGVFPANGSVAGFEKPAGQTRRIAQVAK